MAFRRRGLSQTLVLAVIAILALGTVAAVVIWKGGSGGSSGQEGGQSENTTTTTGSSSGEGVQLEGRWTGTYTGQHGSGEWTWVVKRMPDGTYRGCLQTTGTYNSNGGWMAVSVTVEGNQITFGAVSVGVTFTGTINGDQVSGTWSYVGGYDSGNWEGHRVGPADTIPCMQQGGGGQTTTTHSGGGQGENTTTGGASYAYPPTGTIEDIARNVTRQVLEFMELSVGDNVSINFSRVPGLNAWNGSINYSVCLYDASDDGNAEELYDQIVNYMRSYNFVVDPSRSTGPMPMHDPSTRAMGLAFVKPNSGLVVIVSVMQDTNTTCGYGYVDVVVSSLSVPH